LIIEGIEIQQTSRVADIFAQISCYVCQAPSSGIHFGMNSFSVVFLNLNIDG
jgi:hypothetical protein